MALEAPLKSFKPATVLNSCKINPEFKKNIIQSTKMEDTGIDPVAYRMQSDRSTIWANPPVPLGWSK